MSGYAPGNPLSTVGLRYTPAKHTENGLNTTLAHLTGMERLLAVSTEELRWTDYSLARSSITQQNLATNSMFGNTGGSLFGGTGQAAGSNGLFGAASRPAGPATTPISFGGAITAPNSALPLQTSQPLFGGAAASAAPASSLFGAPTSIPLNCSMLSTGGSQLAAPIAATPSKPGLFTSGSSSIFGGPSTSLFGATQPATTGGFGGGSSLFSGGATGTTGLFSGLGGGVTGQQTQMVAPTNLFAPAVLAQQPALPVGDTSHLSQASKDPFAIFSSEIFTGLLQGTPVHDLAHSPPAEAIRKRKLQAAVRPTAVPIERWTPTPPVRVENREKPAFCDLLDIAPKGKLGCNGSFKEWLSSGKASVAPSESTEVVEISIKGLPEGPIRVPKNYTVAYLKARVCKAVKGVEADQVVLWYRGRMLESEEGLESVKTGAEMYYVIGERRDQGVKDIAAEKYLPTLSRPDYSTTPSLTDIARMSLSELQSIHSFLIQNSHGSVEFPGRTDLTALDLDSIVHIYKDSVVLYPEGCRKPKVGEGLNKKAKITLFQIFPRKVMSGEAFREKLRKICLKDKTNFHSYDEDSGVWMFTTNPEKAA